MFSFIFVRFTSPFVDPKTHIVIHRVDSGRPDFRILLQIPFPVETNSAKKAFPSLANADF